MNNIKTYRDGSRLIVVIENCTGARAAKVNQFILDVLECDTEPVSVPEIIPEKVPEEPVPDITKATPIVSKNEKVFEEPASEELVRAYPVSGVSGTLGRAMDTGDTAAVIKVCLKARDMDEPLRIAALAMCKKYLLDDCRRRDADCTGTAEIRKFFRIYKPLIGDAIKQILDSAGYATLDDFFSLTDEYMHQDAYRVVVASVIERVQN